jgi:polygalacturonase
MIRPLGPLLLALATLDPAVARGATLGITPAPDATHVVEISGDTVTIARGRTYSFTVDTPEDQGLISTAPSAKDLLAQFASPDGSAQSYRITGQDGAEKTTGLIEAGDHLIVIAADGQTTKSYALQLKPAALSGRLRLKHDTITTNTPRDLTVYFTAGQRSPDATVRLWLPAGIEVTLDNTTVNVIGRGAVKLRDLPTQSIGRVGSAYSYAKVGEVAIAKSADGGGSIVTFQHLDLRPANGADLAIVIGGVKLAHPGAYAFKADYTTSQPEILTSAGVGAETATLTAVPTISDFARVIDRSLRYRETPETYTSVNFTWTAGPGTTAVRLMHSLDAGQTWTRATATIDPEKSTARIAGLAPNQLHQFRLQIESGENQGASNVVQFYSGKMDLKSFGVTGGGQQDDTEKINAAIAHLARLGGGTLLFSAGTYRVRTVHLQSNVYLYVDRGATIAALKGADAPESTWFSDRKYRSGLSPTDFGPYENPENWLTKQDVGHHYFHNAMFCGERLDNVKIIGPGRITGDGNLVTGDNVMRNAPGNRADKMFVLKLCTNLEIGGVTRDDDLWYDPAKDEPYYLAPGGGRDFDVANQLQIDRGGHFVLLATGTDGINVHDTYLGRHASGNSRDIYDFMECNDVAATNIYCKVTSDDIVKPGSDCALGFTRPAQHYRVRNIIGDTNCNLFQIGSETADDIQDLHVDNIYVTGANKAGFSISTNDGAHVKDVYLNSGATGPLHSRSQMRRTQSPFFISISNRGRVLGATVARFKFDENGKAHDEFLNTNINLGVVENIFLNGVDVSEIYGGSSYGNKPRWAPYDGKQRKAAPIIAGYKLPDAAVVQGGLTFKLPNGKHTGYIKNVVFTDVHFLAKGGNPATDAARRPPELGVGKYNVADLGVLPAYGLYARHVEGLTLTNCSFNYEKRDSTPPLLLDDVVGAKLRDVKMVRAADQPVLIRMKGSRDVTVEKAVYFEDVWGASPTELPAVKNTAEDVKR